MKLATNNNSNIDKALSRKTEEVALIVFGGCGCRMTCEFPIGNKMELLDQINVYLFSCWESDLGVCGNVHSFISFSSTPVTYVYVYLQPRLPRYSQQKKTTFQVIKTLNHVSTPRSELKWKAPEELESHYELPKTGHGLSSLLNMTEFSRDYS